MLKRYTNSRSLLAILIFISCISTFISYSTKQILSYNDAAAHLNTARRVVDSLTPGFAQIGSVWLPLLHILELPFVVNTFLWQSGLAGSIVSGLSFVVAVIFLYKLIYLVLKDFWSSVIGTLVMVLNLNLLYIQTTAMFEPLLLATALGSIYFLAKWVDNGDIRELIKAAFFTMLATLTRYDGWALFCAEALFVLLYSFKYKRSKTESLLLVFLFLAGFGIFLWFLYNLMIFSDPLYFLRGEFSAASQQQVLALRGQLSTKNNLGLSILTYAIDTSLNIGILVSISTLLGLLFFLKKNADKVKNWVPLLFLTPFVFNIAALYLGQSVIWLPMLPPFFRTYFNARYGILMLPAAAFFTAYLTSKNTLLKLFSIFIISAQLLLFIKPSFSPFFWSNIGIITLADTVSSVNNQTINASRFLHDHYKGGLILVSSASEDAFIFRVGLPLRYFITEGSSYYWKQSLKDPRTYATWIVFFKDKSDRVGKAIGSSDIIKQDYQIMYTDQTYEILLRK